MLVTSNSRTPFLGLPEGNCDFLKGTTLFRYSPFSLLTAEAVSTVVRWAQHHTTFESINRFLL